MGKVIACTTTLVNNQDTLKENPPRNTKTGVPTFGEGPQGPEPNEAGGSENGPAGGSSEEPPLPLHRPSASGVPGGGASEAVVVGGRPCNTSPADQHAPKKINKLRVLCGGVDTLEISTLLTYDPENILETLQEMRKTQDNNHEELHGVIRNTDEQESLYYTLKTQSTRFMTYILASPRMNILLQKNPEANIKHNCQAKIRSETLWERGYQGALDYFVEIMKCAGAKVNTMTVSRVDMCVDILVPAYVFASLPTHYVTLAKGDPMQYGVNPINSFYLGKGGDITLRLYDKAKEIEEVSGKGWMRDIWGLQEIPEGYRVMRVEAQIKRDALREFGINTTGDLQEKQGELWKYITEKWLQYKESPGRETWRRKISPWWKKVQNGYPGAEDAKQALRSHLTKKDQKRRYMVAKAAILALHAGEREDEGNEGLYETMGDAVATFARAMLKYDLGIDNVTDHVMELRKRYRRTTA